MKKLTSIQSNLSGTIQVPGDKSISHRSIMFAAVAKGTTRVSNFLLGADCLSTISCFQKMGVMIDQHGDEIIIQGKGWDSLSEPTDILDVGNSGTTTRLLMGILAGRPFHSVIIGDHSIAKRPMNRVSNPLQQMGAQIDGREFGNYTPISIRGGNLKAISYQMPVASAQVKSAILLAGLQADGVTTVEEMRTTRDHTERMIRHFGGEIEQLGKVIKVQGGQTLQATEVRVPSDISSAAFFMVAAAIVPNSELILPNVGLNKTRAGIIEVMERMGASIELIQDEASSLLEPTGTIKVSYSSLQGVEIGGDLIPRLIDEIPIIALLATQAEGKTVIKDAEELKVKETNRIDTVVQELTTLGANIEATPDGMIICGPTPLSGGNVSSHGDHRIGMMLSIASLICENPIFLEDAEAIDVSYPSFFQDLDKLVK
ncbi:3-phosphoshikimate 1-carboxyvinyltransferase [Heyndrickxia ginsengihumi]|uniref:3-phosphoshikimate 1-carboxyvinyltransferase n=1 Tax=Heyndrickxia ginsengihumi TaxID=363870 RepID=A0A0A6VGM1_9BACI|nr:3-phosphoshikimate 1-carboxyvinyltransferase [Heyndrickxia ginsengihumi]KHD85769.1 3-phosphoshikimate 1-carboxyvinyltransferase [Heyndrickxia ginsengihumi]MBE6183489.1 3-phosphoshikimate 1-carboxyvinyltransferase [Bacillus sp. (in: firmicutes)]MCM3022928.1 3-phosphoshikimate 1-carboxyvinyltransferase [Heyndrickxia ginsengihumi]NEY20644.1 3-phosphoshikimate 1-carboxyvinyltransferase [Heyndrickxia ginsengihumi]